MNSGDRPETPDLELGKMKVLEQMVLTCMHGLEQFYLLR